VSGYADFFCLAQRFRCAAAIFSRASAERARFFMLVLFGEVDAEGRPYLGTARLGRLTPMHQHRAIAEAVSVLGRTENQPLPKRGRC
jgi:hypothetical protein